MWLLLALLTAAPQPPTWAAEKRGLSPTQLARKKEGVYLTGVPLTAYDPDRGVGYGVRVYVYANGKKDDPLFAVSPYFHRAFVQFFRTTGGFESHSIKWDAPYILGTPYRIRSALAYERDRDAGYFGLGEASLHSTLDENRDIADRRRREHFYRVDVNRPRWNVNLERDLWGGRIRPLAGVQISRVWVRDTPPSKLHNDFLAGRIRGYNGGWDNLGKLGVAYDSRDYEPNPTAGGFNDFTTEIGRSFAKANLALRGYLTPITRVTTLTVAGRVVAQQQWGRVPFYELGTLTYTQGDDQGLGGLRSLRGYPESRFIGRAATLANLELRWTFAETVAWSQRFGFMAAPFVDSGSTYDRTLRPTLRDWQTGAGAALRVIWNLATILTADYGMSHEGGAFYVNFGLTY